VSAPSHARLCVGLTGGIGSGKSTVASLFEQHGAGIIDTDLIAHRLTQNNGKAIPAIRAAFGEDYIGTDGAMDRAKMRALVFSDADAKLRLEQIVHPLIRAEARTQLMQLQACVPYIILVVPLLPESPAFRQMVQRILVVDCDETIQAARVIARSGLNETEARAIISRQTPRAARLQLADDVIRNEGGLGELAAQVALLHQQYTNMCNNY